MLPITATQRPRIPRAWSFHSVAWRLTLAAVSALALTITDGALAASITLEWTPPTNTTMIAGYQVHYGATSGNYTQVSDVAGATTTTATVTNLTAGSTYFFAVRSRNQDSTQTSAFANEVSARIPANDIDAPTASLSASPTGPYTTARTVTFTASATDNVGVARVDFYEGTTLVSTDNSAPYNYAWSVTSATNGNHSWTAKAYDAAGNVGTSAVLALVVNIDATAPTVSAITASGASPYTSAQIVTLGVTAGDNQGVTRLELYDGNILKGTTSSSSYTYAWSVTNANNGSHTWTAKAYDAAGNVGTSAALNLTVNINIASPDTAAPTTPSGLGASVASDSQIDLTWTASTDNVGVTGYRVERCLGAGCSNFAQVATTTATRYSDTGLAANTTYRYRVRATDAAGNISGYCATATAATTAQADAIGVFRATTRSFYLDTDASFDWSTEDTVSQPFGVSGDTAIVGDWTGDGIDKIGVYRPSNHGFVLDIDGSNSATAADRTFTSFGNKGDVPVIGDWNGDGVDKIGVYRPSTRRFILDADNSHSASSGDINSPSFGNSGDLPVAGDWNGDGIDDIGVYRPSTGRFYLDMDNSHSWTTSDIKTGVFGNSKDLPVVGDWNADGTDEIGLYRPSTRVYYLDVDGSGSWTSGDIQTAPFGNTGDKPLSGRWQAAP